MKPLKQLRVVVQLRNNLLQQRREELGLTQAGLCRAAGIGNFSTYCKLESMKESPFGTTGAWRPSVLMIARFHGLPPEELFPPEILKLRGGSRSMTCDVTEFAELAAGGPEALLVLRRGIGRARAILAEACTPREAEVLTKRLGLDGNEPKTFEVLADDLGLSRERIRQLESRGLRRIADAIRRSPDYEERRDGSHKVAVGKLNL